MNDQIETTEPMALPSDIFVAKHAYKMKSAGVIMSSQIMDIVFDFLVKSDKVPCNQKPKHVLDAKKSGDILNVFYATGGKCGLFEYQTSISCEDFKRVTGIDLGGTRK